MRRFVGVPLLVVLFATAAPHGQSPTPSDLPAGDETPHAWFVQLESPPTVEGGSVSVLDAEASSFHEAAAGAGLSVTTTHHYRALWNGLAVTTDADPEALRELDGVSAVYPVVTAVRAKAPEAPTTVADMVSALAAAGVDAVQNELGLTGRGVRVAVMDSGIDYDHPDLGGCFGQDCRVAKGWDFVGDAFNPDRTSPTYNPVPRPDANPDDCDGHGTHVAGIIGANGTIRGVAPAATLHAYRVFGCVGPTTTDVLLAAMERAYVDGADILNVSLGAAYQWPQYPTAQAAARLVRLGLIVVASGGNEGANGLYAAAAPGIAKGVISVASFDNPTSNLSSGTVSPDDRRIGYLGATGSVAIPISGSSPLARTGTIDSLADACTALPADSLAGQIALIRRGTCGFPVKAANAQAAGAVAIVFYNNAAGRISLSITGGTPIVIPAISVSGEDGAVLDARLAAGPVTFTWTADAYSEPNPTANLISSFSSYGPTADLALKPDLGAPGGAIRSTLPLELGGFGNISGTSMSAPYVSGAVALMLEAHPDLNASDVLVRLQNHATPRPWSGNPTAGIVELVHRQGAGLIAVDQSVKATAEVRPSALALGEFDTPAPVVRRLQIHALRHGDRDACKPRGRKDGDDRSTCHRVTYVLGHEPAAASGAATFAPTAVPAFASVEFAKRRVTVGDRGDEAEATINVLITPPTNPAGRLFGGYITFTPDDGGSVLRVPYLGHSGDYQSIQALTPTPAGFPWLAKVVGPSLISQPSGASFTFVGGDSPVIVFHLEHQVRRLRAEIVDVVTGDSYGPVDDQQFVGRNSSATSFFVLTWNGTYVPKSGPPRPVPNGVYRLEIAALKARGDKHNPDHIERWTSPPIAVVRP